jgi:hypothetical protein
MLEIGPSDTRLALLYASDRLDTTDAAEFERRLGEDQELRESLCQAVEMMYNLEGLPALAPSAAYRAQVRQRLRLRRSWWDTLTHRRNYRGHPIFWSGLGAMAAFLFVLALLPQRIPPDSQGAARIVEAPRSAAVEEPLEALDTTATSEIAETFASLPTSDHLVRACEEEIRRRDRRPLHGDHVLHLVETHDVRH